MNYSRPQCIVSVLYVYSIIRNAHPVYMLYSDLYNVHIPNTQGNHEGLFYIANTYSTCTCTSTCSFLVLYADIHVPITELKLEVTIHRLLPRVGYSSVRVKPVVVLVS